MVCHRVEAERWEPVLMRPPFGRRPTPGPGRSSRKHWKGHWISTRRAKFLSAGRPIAEAIAAIPQSWVEGFAIPGVASDEVTTRIEFSRSGDLVFQIWKYTLTQIGPNGASTQLASMLAVIWKNKPIGSWKPIVDAHNAGQKRPTDTPSWIGGTPAGFRH